MNEYWKVLYTKAIICLKYASRLDFIFYMKYVFEHNILTGPEVIVWR